MNDEMAWTAADNIYTLITQSETPDSWRKGVMDVLKMAWVLGYDAGGGGR